MLIMNIYAIVLFKLLITIFFSSTSITMSSYLDEREGKSLYEVEDNLCNIHGASEYNGTLIGFQQQPCLLSFLFKKFNTRTLFLAEFKNDILLANSISECNSINKFEILKIPARENIGQMLLVSKLSHYQTFIVVCSSTCTSLILNVANSIGLSSTEYSWYIFYPELLYAIDKLPTNIIAAKLMSYYKEEDYENKWICKKNESTSYEIFTMEIHKAGPKWKLIAKLESNNLTVISNLKHVLLQFPGHKHEKDTLNVVTVLESPFTIIHRGENLFDEYEQKCLTGKVCWKYDEHNNLSPHCCIGYCMDLLDRLEQDVGFRSIIYIVKDSAYGAKVNGSWKGMVGDIVNEKADIALAALTITAQRADVVDFTDAYLVGGAGIAIKIERTPIPFFNIGAFSPLSSLLWLAVYTVLVLTCIILVVLARLVDVDKKWSYHWLDSLACIASLMFQRELGGKLPPFRLSTATVTFSVAVFMLVIMTTYTAVLTANKVTYRNVLPISGFKDTKITNPTRAFKYATINNSAFTQMFHDSTDPDWNRMYHFMKPYNFQYTDHAFKLLRSGELNAIIHDYPVILDYIAKEDDCSIQFAGSPIQDAGYGLAIKKGSYHFKKQLSELLRRYQTEGLTELLQNKWISSKCVTSQIKSGYTQIGINYFGGLFTLMICAMVMATVILGIEQLVFKLSTKVQNKRKMKVSK